MGQQDKVRIAGKALDHLPDSTGAQGIVSAEQPTEAALRALDAGSQIIVDTTRGVLSNVPDPWV